MAKRSDFSELAWLFTSNNLNRGILRQNFDEAAMLWKAVSESKGPILEIGRRHGGSTVLLVEAAADRMVTSIDLAPAHHALCESYFQKMQSANPHRMRLIVGNSRTPVEGTEFGFAFIDGDHTYEGVKADVIAHWSSLKAIEGVPAGVVFHDAVPNNGLEHKNMPNHHEGVRRVCAELLSFGCAEKVAEAGSSLWLRKIAELPPTFLSAKELDSGMVETTQAIQYSHLKRREDVAKLAGSNAIGIELGVAEGVLADRLLTTGKFEHLFGVDMYAGDRGHDLTQYKRALAKLSKYRGHHSLLHMKFHEALDLFPDEYFDFVYVDGYAHTGEEGGRTFEDWWSKLKPGGVFAGDDYDPAWPEVVANVNKFLSTKGLTGYVIPSVEKDIEYCKYPTWFTIKK